MSISKRMLDPTGYGTPPPCARCGLELKGGIIEQVSKCAYCRENGNRIAEGKRVLPAPTDEYPAGRNA